MHSVDWPQRMVTTCYFDRRTPGRPAARSSAERGSPKVFKELFGTFDEPHIEVWDIPTGSVFRISGNGNHRLTAFAVLDAPCVLAEITWIEGPFVTQPFTTTENDLIMYLYRRLLHTFDVASFPAHTYGSADDISTSWPILIRAPGPR
ncbi:hypothetical protein [Rhodococcus sp. BH5]|uniref:hypothetical protein n=1 Tax=Rhodococcus sp. BH5 TaxID=2871702 RepID=UPI0022CD4E3B|nr:hypothetical protein [Rhodococcus sp. BH5]MCZ9635231.1 hypothetical protein [Rhodococcus sp. BH5]